jgi:hypothetical protein
MRIENENGEWIMNIEMENRKLPAISRNQALMMMTMIIIIISAFPRHDPERVWE